MTPSPPLAALLFHLRALPSRTGSVVVTVYGDVVVPRGGSLWLGTLLEFFATLGVGGGVVRTAMSRLAADGLLERNRVGRNSYYRLAEKGRELFADAARRIYGRPEPAWDGAFRLAVLEAEADRDAARAALERAGYAALAPTAFVAPGGAAPACRGLIHLRACTGPAEARRLATLAWPGLARVAEGYRSFLALFGPLEEALGQAGLSGLEALAARVLLIHEYRRVLLRDPLLPAALLEEDWPGHAARALCARLYWTLVPESERWLDIHALAEDGPLPPPGEGFKDRFRQVGS